MLDVAFDNAFDRSFFSINPPSFSLRRWWLLVPLLALVAVWNWPRQPSSSTEVTREAQTLVEAPSAFGTPSAVRGHSAVLSNSTRQRRVAWVGGDSVTDAELAPLRRGKWYPSLEADGPARRHADFTPQHKPAGQVMPSGTGSEPGVAPEPCVAGPARRFCCSSQGPAPA